MMILNCPLRVRLSSLRGYDPAAQCPVSIFRQESCLHWLGPGFWIWVRVALAEHDASVWFHSHRLGGHGELLKLLRSPLRCWGCWAAAALPLAAWCLLAWLGGACLTSHCDQIINGMTDVPVTLNVVNAWQSQDQGTTGRPAHTS